MSDYRSFQAIDNDGKNLFDVVTSSVWNARCQLIGWLEPVYAKDSDRVDLLYAILDCHGWTRSDARSVVVRLEPLQQLACRAAQEQLCRKLTGLGRGLPAGSGCASRSATRRFDAEPLWALGFGLWALSKNLGALGALLGGLHSEIRA